MVRRHILTKRASKTIRKTKSEQYLINKKYLGDEPEYSEPMTKLDFTNSLNWYNYMCNIDDAREYLAQYLINIKCEKDAKRINSFSDNEIPTTLAWVSRMYTKGYQLPDDAQNYLNTNIKKILNKNIEIKEEEPKISVKDRMKERFHEIMGEIEGLIDDHIIDNEEFSLYNWLQSNNIPAAYATSIINKLSPVLNELNEAYKITDEQLKEAYRSYSKKELKKLIDFYQNMCDDVSKYSGVVKKTRAPRKPRTVSVEKKIKNVKYQKEDSAYKIASVSPEKIIGAQELWTFNTKYKTLTVLRAIDRGGLQIKGTSILNYDETTSCTKGTGRRTENYVKRVLEGGKIVLRKIMDELKTDKSLAYRMNENTILLRVIS